MAPIIWTSTFGLLVAGLERSLLDPVRPLGAAAACETADQTLLRESDLQIGVDQVKQSPQSGAHFL